jgi:hypothetical protein
LTGTSLFIPREPFMALLETSRGLARQITDALRARAANAEVTRRSSMISAIARWSCCAAKRDGPGQTMLASPRTRAAV